MSYTVSVVSGPVPAENDQAWDHLEKLYAEQDECELPPSAQMSAFHEQLTSRFPCICDDPDGPWSDGPLINNFGRSIATVGISYSRVKDTLPALIQVATGAGFTVFDGQDEKIHRPATEEQQATELQLEDGTSIDDPTTAQIKSAIESLDDSMNHFAILSRTELTYIQVARAEGVFVVEYQEGTLDKHFRTKRDDLSSDEVVGLFSGYKAGESGWASSFEWEQEDLSGGTGCFSLVLLLFTGSQFLS